MVKIAISSNPGQTATQTVFILLYQGCRWRDTVNQTEMIKIGI